MGMLVRFGFSKSPAVGEEPAPATAPMLLVRRAHVFGARRDPLHAVVENLRLVLNTKEGYGWFLPGFGLGNYFASAAGGEALATLVAEIEANVRQFEPRLAEPSVVALGRDEAWIALRLIGRLADRWVALSLRFNVSFGSVRVEVEDHGRG